MIRRGGGGGAQFGARTKLPGTDLDFYRLERMSELGISNVDRLPRTTRVLLENALRRAEIGVGDPEAALRLAMGQRGEQPVEFMPVRVLMPDSTGIPALIDLAALRSAVARSGGDPSRVDAELPAHLVVDHSVTVQHFGSPTAAALNEQAELRDNAERYSFLRWAAGAFGRVRVLPPGRGICHQINLEQLSDVAAIIRDPSGDGASVVPDTVLGADSHTPMVNGAGVLGWGVGGVELESVLLGNPVALPVPEVLAVRLVGGLDRRATATDVALWLTERFRAVGVVGRFLEFCGPGLVHLTVPDRATVANMCPEYGATAALFPVDDVALDYLRLTARDNEKVGLVERYYKEQGLFGDAPGVSYEELIELDLADVQPSVAGPRRPQDRVPLDGVPNSFSSSFAGQAPRTLPEGAVVIAAITSCTNTSNPSVMLAAGLLAREARRRGLRPPPHVKTSHAPGSLVVMEYLRRAGLADDLAALGFDVVGFGCTTCVGNSGGLAGPEIEAEVIETGAAVAAVLSGNRNFEGRIHPLVRAAYLASPPLVVAFALAGTVLVDLNRDPIATDDDGNPVYLHELWPDPEAVRAAERTYVTRARFARARARVLTQFEEWSHAADATASFAWPERSTYILEPPFFGADLGQRDFGVRGARALALLGDSVSTDHISPVSSISPTSPAGEYLQSQGVELGQLHTYLARRGNHHVMMRGTFANPRLRNRLADREGGWTTHLPSGDQVTIFEAAQRYTSSNTPVIVLAGRDFGVGSSRDWAAKGMRLLGVRAVIAESFERIHRENLICLGILPLQLEPGISFESMGLTGRESFELRPDGDGSVRPRMQVGVAAEAGSDRQLFKTTARVESEREAAILAAGGMYQLAYRRAVAAGSA